MVDDTEARSAEFPLVRLAVLVGLLTLHGCIRAYHALEPSDEALYLYNFSLAWLLVSWLYVDCRSSRYWPCFEYDWFMFVVWPVVLPHYLVKTRGKRGVFRFLVFLAVAYLVPAVCAATVSVAVSASSNGGRF